MTDDLRLMVVDDNDDCRDLYELWLENRHVVHTARNGTEALDMVDSTVDLVLIDRNMPGPNGLAVATEMRENGYEGGIFVVSSESKEFDIQASPVDDYLQKPTSRTNIERAVERFAKRRKLQSWLDEYYALTETLASMEAEQSGADSGHSEEYARTKRRVEKKRTAIRELLETTILDWEAAFSVLEDPATVDTPETTCPDSMLC